MRMNKKSKNKSEIIDLIDASNEITKLRSEDQYFVTLNILNNRRARSTEKPNDPPLVADQTTSNTLPVMTKQSNRLNADLI